MNAELLPVEPALYSLDEAQEVLRIGRTALRGHIAAGRLRRVMIGRRAVVRRDDLEAFIEAATSGRERQRHDV